MSFPRRRESRNSAKPSRFRLRENDKRGSFAVQRSIGRNPVVRGSPFGSSDPEPVEGSARPTPDPAPALIEGLAANGSPEIGERPRGELLAGRGFSRLTN